MKTKILSGDIDEIQNTGLSNYDQLLEYNLIKLTEESPDARTSSNTILHDSILEENEMEIMDKFMHKYRKNLNNDSKIESILINTNPRKSTPYHTPSKKPRNNILNLHMNSKPNVEKFPCQVPQCGKAYSNKIKLTHHMESNHDCTFCGNHVSNMNELKRHKLKEHNIAQ